ncbi:hypothetical protein CsatB_010550 [Cannabis sativa]
MLSKIEAGKKIGEDSGSGKLLNEIEAISKALYIDKHTSRSLIPRPNYGIKYGGKTHLPDTNSNVKHATEEPSRKEKKSIWNWKALKAFSHIRNRRFNCCFSLQVHSIEGLPSNFDEVSLCVHWKRRDGDLVTRPVKVSQGLVEFEERLTITCSVYGSRSGPHHSAKYEAKHFLLYASVYGAHEIDLGKHRIDLTKLLPLTLEELEEESSSGKWTTSYKLSGKAKGATMNVSFGYTVLGDNLGAPGNRSTAPDMLNMRQNNLTMVKSGNKFRQVDGRGRVRRSDSLPNISQDQLHTLSRSVEDIKDLHEVLPVSRSELASSVDVLYRKLEEETLDKPFVQKPEFGELTEPLEPIKPDSYSPFDSGREDVDNGCDESDFSVTEQGVELSLAEPGNSEQVIVETANVSPVVSRDVVEVETDVQVDTEVDTKICSLVEEDSSNKDELEVQDCISEQDEVYTKESLMKELESALNGVSDLEAAALDSPGEEENYEDIKLDFEGDMKGKSLSLDDLTESVANEFFDMLGIEGSPSGLSSGSEPESPRERLLRQFEKEALAGGCPLFGFDLESEEQAQPSYSDTIETGWSNSAKDLEFSSLIQAAEEEHLLASQVEMSKNKAKILEDLETEALMREWGLNERAFQHSPPESSAGFGSPIDLPPEGPPELPPLGEGLGPFLQTKDGGFLRSMTPSLFTNAKNSGNLVMQVSSPVVVPADMGSGIMEILQQLASIGIEKLSMQANKLMPLEDITGKTMQQMAWEADPSLEGPQSECLLQHEPMVGLDSFAGQVSNERSSRLKSRKNTPSSVGRETASEYVSLEDLAPLAMDKIEALSIEGLRIQSGMSDEEAPSNISAQSIGEISALQGKGINPSGSLGLDGTGGLQLLDTKESSDDVDGLMGLSLTLDEWMRLDSGELDDDENQISERTSKILAAHHAHSLDYIRGRTKGERRKGKGSGRKCGLLGNNFTVALMVQLRDPMRNYEPVGTPMLSLIQVERVFIPPKPKIYSTVSELRKYTEEDDDEATSAIAVKEEIIEEPKLEKAPEEEGNPQYRITEVHVAGLKAEPGKKKLWGNSTQQQSGSRWLVANGMGKSNKNPFLKSKPTSKSNVSKSKAPEATTKVQPGETLWSISSRIHGTGSKWKELAALNPHIRNPNVIFPNETIKLW